MGATSAHVELEAAKFLQKLTQEGQDQPIHLATRLFVMCQHLKLTGKENTLPYQVIYKAMETVINQHRIDWKGLYSSSLAVASGSFLRDLDHQAPSRNDTADKEVLEKTLPEERRPGASINRGGTPIVSEQASAAARGQTMTSGERLKQEAILSQGTKNSPVAAGSTYASKLAILADASVDSGSSKLKIYAPADGHKLPPTIKHFPLEQVSVDTVKRNQPSSDLLKAKEQTHIRSDNPSPTKSLADQVVKSSKRKREDAEAAAAQVKQLRALEIPLDNQNRASQKESKLKGIGAKPRKGRMKHSTLEVQTCVSSSLTTAVNGPMVQSLQEEPMRDVIAAYAPSSQTKDVFSNKPLEAAADVSKLSVGEYSKGSHFNSSSSRVFMLTHKGKGPQGSILQHGPDQSRFLENSVPRIANVNQILEKRGKPSDNNPLEAPSITWENHPVTSGSPNAGTHNIVPSKAATFNLSPSTSIQNIGESNSRNDLQHSSFAPEAERNLNVVLLNKIKADVTSFAPEGFRGALKDYLVADSALGQNVHGSLAERLETPVKHGNELAVEDHPEGDSNTIIAKDSSLLNSWGDNQLGLPSRIFSTSNVAHAVEKQQIIQGGPEIYQANMRSGITGPEAPSVIRNSDSDSHVSLFNNSSGMFSSCTSMQTGHQYCDQQNLVSSVSKPSTIGTNNILYSRDTASNHQEHNREAKKAYLSSSCIEKYEYNDPLISRSADGLHVPPNVDQLMNLPVNNCSDLKDIAISPRVGLRIETEAVPYFSETQNSGFVNNDASQVDISTAKLGAGNLISMLPSNKMAMDNARGFHSVKEKSTDVSRRINLKAFPEDLITDTRSEMIYTRNHNHSKGEQLSRTRSWCPFSDLQLKQLRAQCYVFLALRKKTQPRQQHLALALENLERKGLFKSETKKNDIDGKPMDISDIGDASLEDVVKDSSVAPQETSNNDASMPVLQDKESRSESHDPCLLAVNERDANSGSGFGSLSDNQNLKKEEDVDDDEEDGNFPDDFPNFPTKPEHTTIEKWVLDEKKRKYLEEQAWAQKQRKTEEMIAVRFHQLKEVVNSYEDISTKTKNIIELKKLELLQLQRRLRRDFLYGFFKPIMPDIDVLRTMKKNRPGRRLKQLEKLEMRQKEERLRRIKERENDFFREVEMHKERLDDWYKGKRERTKGFNRYVKDFHKKKERVHREKLERIQREKINLLKNNDVEGYLRMVQDTKSDRVKQLLKETEAYLQKLGLKIQQQKSQTKCNYGFHSETDCEIDFISEYSFEDQAQHYLESNEKYYLMAHSVKEHINEQPSFLQGGKLREYQMYGLRWMVSLYNNNLNGILADEMGLGKTVQVIALLAYLIEKKNDCGPFLVVVPSSVLPNWLSELNNWAPMINKVAYTGIPEERRRLFREKVAQQKFNVLVTTYEYLMNKHDRPKLSKIFWHYIIIDEGHRIKNASCKLNAELKYYQSNHRLLLTGTPLQNKLEELWALLNFLLPEIFNSSEDFAEWFNKPFENVSDNSPDQALLSEEENLLIINRLHQVLRPFMLRRLKQKVENELPEKIERLVRCKASAYQQLLMKRVKEKLGSLGHAKDRTVHNTVMELRNICNHPYLSHLHTEEAENLMPRHYLPPIVRLCGKLETLDRILPKLKACNHRVLLFSTMTRLLNVMEDYLTWKGYQYLRLDGHTCGSDRGALIEQFNSPDSDAFLFLLSIRAGGVGINLQAADTVILFDTDWNPQVDLQAQARAHRIGQKRDVLVLRLETIETVEEQVRAAAEYKLGVANQSITAGFFDNNTSAEDRKEYLEALLRESKKEEAGSVLDDEALNYLLARSETEIDIFEAVDKARIFEEKAQWRNCLEDKNSPDSLVAPPRLFEESELKPLLAAMHSTDGGRVEHKRKGGNSMSLDTHQYGRGKRAREVRSYEDQLSEREFEELCEAGAPGIIKNDTGQGRGSRKNKSQVGDGSLISNTEQIPAPNISTTSELIVKKSRGRPKKILDMSPAAKMSQLSGGKTKGVKRVAFEMMPMLEKTLVHNSPQKVGDIGAEFIKVSSINANNFHPSLEIGAICKDRAGAVLSSPELHNVVENSIPSSSALDHPINIPEHQCMASTKNDCPKHSFADHSQASSSDVTTTSVPVMQEINQTPVSEHSPKIGAVLEDGRDETTYAKELQTMLDKENVKMEEVDQTGEGSSIQDKTHLTSIDAIRETSSTLD